VSSRLVVVMGGVLTAIVVGILVFTVISIIAAGENCRDRGGVMVGSYGGYVCIEANRR